MGSGVVGFGPAEDWAAFVHIHSVVRYQFIASCQLAFLLLA
jgi:hypothetical protein